MTAQVLTSELGNIIQDSKKKNTELKNAAEKSLQELKVAPSTSEALFASDLRRRPQFVTPFLLACKTANAKLALPAVTCLQRLIVSSGLPTERLKEVLEAFQECCKINLDVQLKVLQSLPQLLQNYSDALQGDLLSSLLQVCTTLQHVKAVAVSSTAAAILQQIISLLFEKVESEDDRAQDRTFSTEIQCDGETIPVRAAAHDAYRVLEDLCLITEGQKSRFIPNATLLQAFGLELIETVLMNHGELFYMHLELSHLLRGQLMPLITRLLSERLSFPITVRTIRIFCILLREHLSTVYAECEVPLSLLNHFLDADGSIAWKRALCLETYRVIYATPDLVVEIYSLFDEQSGRKSIIQESLATFARLAAEKPALIGLGPQSSFPTGQGNVAQDQAILETGGVAGIITGETGIAGLNVPGISAQWSSVKVPCLDQLDKSEPLPIPETYAYSLVLTCLNGLSDNLARTVLPLTVQSQSKTDTREESYSFAIDTPVPESIEHIGVEESNTEATSPAPSKRRARTLPGNPLALIDHPSHAVLRTIAHMVDMCWPAILASSSTFLNAALDADFYRALVKSFQKFTQLAGLLRLSTPRDAFLTTLAKAAVPPNIMKGDTHGGHLVSSPRGGSHPSAFASVENFLTQTSLDSPVAAKRPSLDIGPSLSQRNLMCLRALINLAIALGSILEESWPIILENLQKADNILAQSSTMASARDYRSGVQGERNAADTSSGQTTVSSEIAAVEAAITRLFQSTADYPSDAFLSLLNALCNLIPDGEVLGNVALNSSATPSLRRTSSMLSMTHTAAPQARNIHFAIAKLGEVARINLLRLSTVSNDSGWGVLTDKLLKLSTSPTHDSVARLMAADVLGNVAVGITVASASETPEIRKEVQQRALESLKTEIQKIYENHAARENSANSTDLDVHRSALEALRAILEQCGESLIAGWLVIFDIVNSAFHTTSADFVETDSISEVVEEPGRLTSKPVSAKIARSAFASVRLICSDFLASLRKSRVVSLIDIMSRFCSQTGDLNISLTTITLFWELSDFLRADLEVAADDLDIGSTKALSEAEMRVLSAAERGSFLGSWLILQLRLASMTNDPRADVRNGAIHTIFRILDNGGDHLPPVVWQYCLRGVVFRMLQINVEAITRSQASDEKTEQHDEKSLIASSEILLKGFAGSISPHLNKVSKIPEFDDIWQSLLECFSSYLAVSSPDITTFIFDALSQILATADNADALSLDAIRATATLWENSVPSSPRSMRSSSLGFDKALVAYVSTLKQVYRLINPHITSSQILKMTTNLQQCIKASAITTYTLDVDIMTELQTQVLQCLDMLRTDLADVPSTIIKCFAGLVALPYSSPHSDLGGARSLTFIAFSKQAMSSLQLAVRTHVADRGIFDSGAIVAALTALSHSIGLKYKWERQGKEPSMWRRATISAIAITQTVLPAARKIGIEREVMSSIWTQVVNIAAHIGVADLSSPPQSDVLLLDETFDLQSMVTLRQSLHAPPSQVSPATPEQEFRPWLGDASIPDSVRMSYVSALCLTSLIHDSQHALDNARLQSLYTLRAGRTHDPPFSPRLRMCYSSLDQLFALVSAHRAAPKEIVRNGEASAEDARTQKEQDFSYNLATAAFPYLILRCALPLKRYIADQSLRGRMPTPTSQRLELLYVLEKVRNLYCCVGEDAQFDSEGVKWKIPVLNQERRHLEWLVPLINRAGGMARRDKEVADATQAVLDVAFKEDVEEEK